MQSVIKSCHDGVRLVAQRPMIPGSDQRAAFPSEGGVDLGVPGPLVHLVILGIDVAGITVGGRVGLLVTVPFLLPEFEAHRQMRERLELEFLTVVNDLVVDPVIGHRAEVRVLDHLAVDGGSFEIIHLVMTETMGELRIVRMGTDHPAQIEIEMGAVVVTVQIVEAEVQASPVVVAVYQHLKGW